MKRPLIKSKINIEQLVQSCEEFLSFLDGDEYHEDKIVNYENDVFEKVMEAIYGKEVFNFINNKIE